MPKVTVLMITYNHEPFIAQAIEGVLMQEASFDYQLVVIEDCSTDGTREILEEYERRHPDKIRLRLAKTNRNDNWVFSEEVRTTSSPYIATLDGDDYWTVPDKLQKQVDFLDNHHQCTICFHNAMVHYEDGSQASHPFNQSGQKEFSTVEDIWPYNFIPGCTPMLRRAALPELPAWFTTVRWADWALYLLYSEQGKIGYINECMAVYRKHQGGLWSGLDPFERYKSIIRFHQDMNRNFRYKYNDIAQRRLASCYFKLASGYEQAGMYSKARHYALKSVAAFRYHHRVRRVAVVKLMLQLFIPRSSAA